MCSFFCSHVSCRKQFHSCRREIGGKRITSQLQGKQQQDKRTQGKRKWCWISISDEGKIFQVREIKETRAVTFVSCSQTRRDSWWYFTTGQEVSLNTRLCASLSQDQTLHYMKIFLFLCISVDETRQMWRNWNQIIALNVTVWKMWSPSEARGTSISVESKELTV